MQARFVIYALLAIAIVLTVVSVLVPLAERFRLPHTVLLAIAGWCIALAPAAPANSGMGKGWAPVAPTSEDDNEAAEAGEAASRTL